MISLSGQSPSENEKNVSLNTSVEFMILDDGTGIDISSLIVYVNGFRAIDKAEFKDGFDGDNSDISPDGDNYSVIIDPDDSFEVGKTILVKVQVKNQEDRYYNTSYVFKTTPSEPILTAQSPANNAVLRSPQVLYLEFKDVIDGVDKDTLNVSINFLDIVIEGIFQSGYSGDQSAIQAVDDGIYIKIDKEEPFRDGSYVLRYDVKDSLGNRLKGQFNFSVSLKKAVLPAVFPQTGFVGYFKGLKKAIDVGSGNAIKLEWSSLAKRYYGSDIYVLVYSNETRLDTFDGIPSYIGNSSISSATLDSLTTGTTLYFGARALETYKDSIDFSNLTEHTDGLYVFPSKTAIARTVLDSDSRIYVDSIEGYPKTGYLVIGSSEVVKYDSVSESDNSFIISSNGRGLNNTSPSAHVEDDEVSFFVACQDSNSVIVSATPTYHGDVDSDREIDSVGVVVTDYEDNDKKFFQGFDFCGYHQALPQQVLAGKNDCGSYLGGEFNKMRGMNLFDRMLNREEVLLDQTGEPVILLRRVWQGQKCSCATLRRDHPKMKSCKACYGTGYEDGFLQYDNKRRPDGLTMVMFADTQEDLSLGSHQHLQQEYEPSCWTIPIPAIKDRDLIVRFDFSGDIEYIYEVLHNTKEKLIFRHYSRQRLSLKRMDKTDIIYTFPFEIPDSIFKP